MNRKKKEIVIGFRVSTHVARGKWVDGSGGAGTGRLGGFESLTGEDYLESILLVSRFVLVGVNNCLIRSQ